MEIKEGLISSAITVTIKTSLYGLPSGNFYDPSFLLGGMHCFTCSFLLFLFLQSVIAPVFMRGAQKAVLICKTATAIFPSGLTTGSALWAGPKQ